MPKKAEKSIPNGAWGSQVSKYPADSPLITDNDITANSKNYNTHGNGMLRKRPGDVPYTQLASPAQDQYEGIFSDGTRHLVTVQNGTVEYSPGDGTIKSVTNGTGFSPQGNFEFATVADRIYMGNGIDAGQVYDRTAVYGLAAPVVVPALRPIGAQAPSTNPTATIVAGAGVPVGGHTYKVTFQYYDLDESNGSPDPGSNLVTILAGVNQQVNLTNIPIGGYGVTARKIYRDNNDGLWRLIGAISDNVTTIFSDNASIGTAVIPTENNVPPTFGLIENFLDRIWIADIVGEPHTIRHSEASMPNVFRTNNFIVCNERDPITAITVFLDRIIVFNRNSMGQILGRSADEFRYSEIQSSVGCVDSRTVQTRIIQGVPHLVWFSDKGIYVYNGNSIEYASENIEDVINLNIQQGVRTKGSNSQTSKSDFSAGVSSDGIDLDTLEGSITTKDTQRIWNDETDWAGGVATGNIAIRDKANTLTMTPITTLPLDNGSYDGTIKSGNNVTLPGVTVIQNETITYNLVRSVSATDLAVSFIPAASGVVTGGHVNTAITNPTILTMSVYSDNAGKPGASIGGLGYASVTGGTRYWLVVTYDGTITQQYHKTGQTSFPSGAGVLAYRRSAGFWFDLGSTTPDGYVTISSSAVPLTGSWTSQIIDTGNDNGTPVEIDLTGSYGAGSGNTVYLEGSNDAGFLTGPEVVQSWSSPTVAVTPSVAGRRYWRVRYAMFTANNAFLPSTRYPILDFSYSGEWVSEIINTTDDSTVFNSLVTAQSVPFPTSVTTYIRTASSTGGIPGASWVPFGSVVVDQYAQVRLVLTRGLGPNVPFVSSINFTWTIVANLVSSVINTGVIPAGWDIFQQSSILNGGTLLFEMRTDDNVNMTSPSSWATVTNGAFPVLAPEQYVQWKVTLTSTPGHKPIVEAVVINWLVSISNPIRATSLFYDRTYYLSAAKFGSSVNNIVIVLNADNNWRIWEDVNINTMSLFFNIPYYCDANTGKISKMFEGDLDRGTDNIEFDVRFKAFDFSTDYADNRDKQKVMRDVVITGKNTGATYTFYYSIDVGNTWITLRDDTGSTSFTSTSDGSIFVKRFKADHSQNSAITGRTIMLRAVSNDSNQVELHKFKIRVFIRKGEPLG